VFGCGSSVKKWSVPRRRHGRRVGACAWSSTTPTQLPTIVSHRPTRPCPTSYLLPTTDIRSNHVTEIRFPGMPKPPPRSRPKLTASVDDHLLPRRPPLPSRICPRSHLPCRNRPRYISTGRHCARCGAQGDEQAVGAGHISREAVHPQRVRRHRDHKLVRALTWP
jgi:hypothetical protein